MKTTLKRVLSLLLALVLMLSLCACTQKSQEDSDEPDNTGGFALPTKNDREKRGSGRQSTPERQRGETP